MEINYGHAICKQCKTFLRLKIVDLEKRKEKESSMFFKIFNFIKKIFTPKVKASVIVSPPPGGYNPAEKIDCPLAIIIGHNIFSQGANNYLGEYFGTKFALDRKIETFEEFIEQTDLVTIENVQRMQKIDFLLFLRRIIGLKQEYDLNDYDATFISGQLAIAHYFEEALKHSQGAKPKLIANWIAGELSAFLNKNNVAIEQSPVGAKQLGELLLRIHDNTISNNIAKQVFEAMFQGEGSADEIIEKKGLKQITDNSAIEKIIDASSLAQVGKDRNYIARNDVAEITLTTRLPVALDNHQRIPEIGRFVLVDQREVSGGGIISGVKYESRVLTNGQSENITWSQGEVLVRERATRNGHSGAVVWLTGLSGAGKSTIAIALERELFNRGMQSYVLDGDNLRYGLNANLGFSPEDRSENIRRAAEVAKLFASAGFIVITSLISPYKADRKRAREIMMESQVCFFEVHIECPLEVCEKRDPKKLYSKARRGEIKEFTGISAPYEVPEKPELIIQTAKQTPPESVATILDYLLQTAGIAETDYEI